MRASHARSAAHRRLGAAEPGLGLQEDAAAAGLLVVEDAVRVLEGRDLRLARGHALLVPSCRTLKKRRRKT